MHEGSAPSGTYKAKHVGYQGTFQARGYSVECTNHLEILAATKACLHSNATLDCNTLNAILVLLTLLAMHYKPFMLKSQGDDKYKYKDKDRVEVQVVSALGNVWAEGMFFSCVMISMVRAREVAPHPHGSI